MPPSLVQNRTFTFKGDVSLQSGYSGVVENLNPLHPLADYNNNFAVDAADYTTWRDLLGQEAILPNEGPTPGIVDQEDYTEWKNRFGQVGHDAIPSPTVTTFEMAFLDVNNAVLGSPVVWNLRDGAGLDAYRTGIDKAMGVAPVGSAKVRVRVSALDMQDNCCTGGQDVLFDNFSLTDGVAGSNRLANGDLNIPVRQSAGRSSKARRSAASPPIRRRLSVSPIERSKIRRRQSIRRVRQPDLRGFGYVRL